MTAGSIADLLSQRSAIRYFSLARHALSAGLRALEIGAGDTVLLPEYICRDLLASLHAVGANASFYPVDAGLSPAAPPERWPAAAAVVAVNYFGFPQALEPFRKYCELRNAYLIEDNAHGLLSRTPEGGWLGFRGDIGIFSMRKTLLLPNGAALVVSVPQIARRLEPQLSGGNAVFDSGLRMKRILRRLPGVGVAALSASKDAVRLWRRVRTGRAFPPPAPDAETRIPDSPAPFPGLFEQLARYSVSAESRRRRRLFEYTREKLEKHGLKPVLASLPMHTVPYGYAFFASERRARIAHGVARFMGFDCIRWPDLPIALEAAAPEHYTHIHVVNFL